MSLKAIIVDDEALAREELEYLLHSVGGVEIIGQAGNGIEAVERIRELQPDIVFLDVQMPGLDGFAVMKRLLSVEFKPMRLPEIVFATAFDRYAVRAFEVNAIDYLLKPFDLARLKKTIEKAEARRARTATADVRDSDGSTQIPSTAARLDSLMMLLEQQTTHLNTSVARPTAKVVMRAAQRLLLVDQKDICFASTEDGIIRLATQNTEGESNCRTLEELMDLLDPEMFWRVHRSHIVNIQHIREVVPWFKSSYQLRMDDKKATGIPVSRTQTKRLRELFNL